MDRWKAGGRPSRRPVPQVALPVVAAAAHRHHRPVSSAGRTSGSAGPGSAPAHGRIPSAAAHELPLVRYVHGVGADAPYCSASLAPGRPWGKARWRCPFVAAEEGLPPGSRGSAPDA